MAWASQLQAEPLYPRPPNLQRVIWRLAHLAIHGIQQNCSDRALEPHEPSKNMCKAPENKEFRLCKPSHLGHTAHTQYVVNDCGCVSMKLYVQKQVTGHIWPVGYTLLTLDLVEKKMGLCSASITLRSLLSAKERLLYYTPHPENLEMTLLTQEAIKTMKGITLGNYLASLRTNTISSNTTKVPDVLTGLVCGLAAEFEDLEAPACEGTWHTQWQP